jgi:uncharacterized delta-60 repeat protein/uncharacterized repeat protein (TIGR01451 family)
VHYKWGNDLKLQEDGKIVVSGFTQWDGGFSYATWLGFLARFDGNGNPDPSFGNNGEVNANYPSAWYKVALQDNGQFVVAGYAVSSNYRSLLLSRYHTNGLLDTNFGTNGKVTTAFSLANTNASAVALLGDGRVVVTGTNSSSNNPISTQMVLARYLDDEGTPAPADVRVSSATISPRTVYPGNFVTYTIPVTNYGPGKAGHLTFTAKTPANTVFISFSAPPGWVVYQQPNTGGTGDVSCSAYELPAGSSVNFMLTVRVSPGVAPGTQINQVSSIKSFMPDPNIFNNTWTKSFTVQ